MIFSKKSISNSETNINVLVFSGIHGNETSGIEANKKLATQIIKGEIKILRGSLTLVLEANEQAIEKGVREVEKNMNRLFTDNIKNTCYEEARAIDLMKLIRESNYLLDLHSTSGPSIPFAYAEENSLELAKKIGINNIISGWGKLSEKKGNNNIAGDTENYMNKKGGQAITFEAGNHNNPNGAEISYKILLNFLATLGIIEKKYYKIIEGEKTHTKITGYYTAKTNSFKYAIKAENFMRLKKGTLIGYDGGLEVKAEEDMILVMPKKEEIVREGIEVFFKGK
ncbi:hypothetical protein CSB07_00020 [Candidatus Gracilibacteria bacterium]|nr:MAG: hypothetical protein CSB07_00020 [Candidatus Gracilibacteria bacterium]PIE85662.1 MAG: hypothetical protein CSA08_00765 [Candidatus Gracilibacteria bacterium]